MSQQEEAGPTMIVITRGREEAKPAPTEKVKKEVKTRSLYSFRARWVQSFEDKLEPWLQDEAAKPQDSYILKAWWWIYVITKLYKFESIPQPRTILSFNRASERIMDRISDLRHLTMAIITVMTAKGGATKTTISTWLAATMAEATKLPPAVFDTNRGGGKVAGRYSLAKEDMLSSRALVKRTWQDQAPQYDTLLGLTGTDKLTGVMVFHHIAGHSISENAMIKTALEMKHRFHSLVVDTSPNLRDPSTFGASAVSTVRIIVGKASSEEDLEDVEQTLNDAGYHLREQLESIVIALSDLPANDCGTRKQYAYAERFKVRPEQIALIPFDPHLKRVGKVERAALTPRARYAITRLTEMVGDTAIVVKTNAEARSIRTQSRH